MKQNFYDRLLAKGKPKKLALVAAIRKLLTILNDMVRDNESWRPAASAHQQNKRDGHGPSLN